MYSTNKLRKFLLVFFDDLLIYSRTWEDHLKHVDEVLSIMEEQSLYAKESKCEIGMTEVLYLGHIIGEKGVQVHQEKIQAIIDWPTLKHLQSSRDFLVFAAITGGLLRVSHSYAHL
jgi:hypothetical protein